MNIFNKKKSIFLSISIMLKKGIIKLITIIIISKFTNTIKDSKMSQENREHNQDQRGTSRRSRKDEDGRDFICGCGKKYLSYPALYTHVKTKHDGVQPVGTSKTGGSASRKPKPKVDERIMKQIQNYVKKQHLQVLNELDENALGEVALNSRIRKQVVGKQIFDAYQILNKQTSLNLDKKSSIQTVLVVYLLGVGQHTSWNMFQYYTTFAKLFRNCHHEWLEQIYNTNFKSVDPRKTKTASPNQCKMAPTVCDIFLRYCVPTENKDPDYLPVISLICFDFCHWMYINKLTIVEVELNKSVELSKRNLIAKSKQKKEQSENGDDKEQEKEESEDHHSSSQSEAKDKEIKKQVKAEEDIAIQPNSASPQ